MEAEELNKFSDKSKSYILCKRINKTLIKGPKIALFLIPFNACNYNTNFEINKSIRGENFNPICSREGSILRQTYPISVYTGPPSKDGWFCYATIDNKGMIESCDRSSLNYETKKFDFDNFAGNFRSCFREYVDIYTSLNINYPVSISLLMCNMDGFQLIGEDNLEIEKNLEQIHGLMTNMNQVDEKISSLLTNIRYRFKIQ